MKLCTNPECEEHQPTEQELNHEFLPVNGHPDDDECTHRADGTDATYCGHPYPVVSLARDCEARHDSSARRLEVNPSCSS